MSGSLRPVEKGRSPPGRLPTCLALLAASAAWACALAASAPPAAGQTGCRLHRVGGYSQSRRAGGDLYNHFASGGVDYRCDGGVRVSADSVAGFQSNRSLQLFGNVRFQDPDIVLEAGRAYYFDNIRQLQAFEDPKVTYRSDGTVVAGDQLIYDLQSESRPLDEMLVYGGQPHATVFATAAASVPASDAAEPAEPSAEPAEASESSAEAPEADPPDEPLVLSPYEIDAERFRIRGRRFFDAQGEVVVLRDSLRAEGDSLSYDQQSGAMSMFGEPRVQDGRFDLTAETVSLTPDAGGAETILARGEARLDGAAVAMCAPAIVLYLEAGALSRLAALRAIPPLEAPGPDSADISPGDAQRLQALRAAASQDADSATAAAPDSVSRPRAFADDFALVADSIYVASPEQVLETVVAVGGARAVATGNDSLNAEGTPEIARNDWMEGDTIVAGFAQLSPDGPDDPSGAQAGPGAQGRALLESLTAAGNARSLYRLPSSDTTRAEPGGPPAVHLALGQRITMYLEDGEVARMHVEGETEGYHFEPLPPGTPPDSATATTSPDSAAAPARPPPADSAAAAPPQPDSASAPKVRQESRK